MGREGVMAFVSFFIPGCVRVRVSYLARSRDAFASESVIFRLQMGYGLHAIIV